MLWDYWLQLASEGSNEASTLVLHALASAFADGTETYKQRQFVADAFFAMAAASPGKARVSATKKHLLLGRRPGRLPAYKAREERLARATAVWDRVPGAEATGACLDKACEEAAIALAIGRPGNDAPDLRAMKKAYLEYLPMFLEIQAIAREPNDSGLGGGF